MFEFVKKYVVIKRITADDVKTFVSKGSSRRMRATRF